MPIYEYRCDDCRKQTTVFFPTFSSVTSPACDHCGSGNVHRLISLVAAVHSTGEDAGADIGGDDDGYAEDDGEGDFGKGDFGGEGTDAAADDDFDDD